MTTERTPLEIRRPGPSRFLLACLLAVGLVMAGSAHAFQPPQAWLDGWLVFQNVMHNHQSLRVDHGGSGELVAEWGEDDAHKWQLEETSSTGFYALRSVEHSSQRLHIDPNGRPKAGTTDDDSYLWRFEEAGNYVVMINKLYPGKSLHVGHNGNGVLYGGEGSNPQTDNAYQWEVHVLGWVGDSPNLTYSPSAHYLINDLVIGNYELGGQNLRTHYVWADRPIVGSGGAGDLAYQWRLEPAPQQDFFYLRNQLHKDLRLHVGHNGNQQVYLSCLGDWAMQWRLEPQPDQAFVLRNRLHTEQRLRLDEFGELSATPYQGPEGQWRFQVTAPVEQSICR